MKKKILFFAFSHSPFPFPYPRRSSLLLQVLGLQDPREVLAAMEGLPQVQAYLTRQE